MKILKEELINFQNIQLDPIGSVYMYKGKIIRVINQAYKKYVERLMKSGLIDKLVKEKLFVDTWVSDDTDEDNRMILEHKYIFPHTSASQWSFEMMKDVAKVVLKINMICWEYGYELKDCHQANILFDGIRPVFVDFGSIVKRSGGSSKKSWLAREDFFQSYYYPMKLWSRGYEGVAGAIMNVGWYFSMKEMRRILFPMIPARMNDMLFSHESSILNNIHEVMIAPLDEMRGLYSKIDRMECSKDTTWGEYQNDYWEKGNARFDEEIEWINKTPDIETMTELGANQGYFSYLVATRTKIKRIYATDYDKKAVNIMYQRLKNKDVDCRITPLVMDFVRTPLQCLREYRSDCVVANALTHHLLLTQGLKMSVLTERLAELTDKYVIVEFMEYGVSQKKSDLPQWYTLDNFLEGLSEKFSVVHVLKTSKKRTMVIGVKK